MAVELFDYSYDRLTPPQIRAAGRAGVIRYVASGRGAVTATRAEVDSYRSSGLTFCGVWQNGKTRALGGSSAGAADARDALAHCSSLGAGSSDPVFFAVDFDAQPGQFPAVVAYFHGAASVLGWHRVGAYGGLPILTHLHRTTPVSLFWQTVSWSAGRVAPFANLLQYAHNQTVAGALVDYNRALTPYYGQWDRMALKSSPRGTAPVIWVVIHTAEGPYDDDPANPSVDPGSVDQLRNYFADPNTQASSHAGCDDDRLSDGWVDYDEAAWTLRNGNSISDNLEICGRAGWTRAQWIQHRPMIRNAAKWAASRCQARGIPARRLTVAQTAARNTAGILDHNTYTQATGDGTHWDVGPGFPWDVFLADVQAFMQGVEPEDGFMAALSDAEQAEVLKAARQINGAVGFGQTTYAGTVEATLGAIQGLYSVVRGGDTALAAKVTDLKSATLGAVAALPTDRLTPEEQTALAGEVARMVSEQGVDVDLDEEALMGAIATGLGRRLAE